MGKTRFLSAALLCVCAMFFIVQAEFYPERIYKERSKTSLDYGWKFFRGTPTGTPSSSSYDDASWTSVNVPHSASYDDPMITVIGGTKLGEGGRYRGICWYRRSFTVPPSAKHTGKILIEFEGAMQTATVWLNGQPLGKHDNSGYTWFQFDITDKVNLTGPNVLAVQLDNTESLTIPPGRTTYNGVSDYYIYSGLYRDVWLICTDKCRIPLWSQRISTPVATASAASVTVHITTPVVSATPGSISVNYIIAFPSTNPVAVAVQTMTIASANGTAVFDTSITIASPKLWTEKTPNLYYLYTQVFKDGALVDDYVDRFGARWYTWTPSAGFALNGTVDTLRGVSLHQSIGWIESALPKSRFFKEVGMVKQMGANMIRGAHFPRDPSFYNACDELGMLCMVEVPTWGCCVANNWQYPDSLFLRLDSCMKEMIEVGYNHPSIIAWGLFNEPPAAYSLPQQMPSENAIAHKMDSTRYTYIASNVLGDAAIATAADIMGINYGELGGAAASLQVRLINTEYHEGWIYCCYRGGGARTIGSLNQFVDDLSAGGYAYQAWNDWLNLWNTTRVNRLAGGTLWAFNDYWSEHGDLGGVLPMGIVDHYRLPKAAFYLYRKYWTGVKDSVPVPGLTPTGLRLDADTNSLIADSTDIAIITASLRASDGRCVDNTNLGQNTDTIPVTFTVTGPANYFGTGIGKLYGGKCALMIKSTNTPGTITVAATGRGFTAAPITIQSIQQDTASLPFLTPVRNSFSIAPTRHLTVTQQKDRIVVAFADKKSKVKIVNFKGETISCPVSMVAKDLVINTKNLAPGYYLVSVGTSATGKITKQIAIMR